MRERLLDRLPLLLGLTFVAVAFGFGAVAIGDGIKARDRHNTITVTGSAKRAIVSDYIVWDATVTAQQKTPQLALGQLNRWTDKVKAFLSGAGAKDSEVTVAPVSTETVDVFDQHGNDTGRVAGYKLTRSFEVRSPRVAAIAGLVEKASALLQQGIPLQGQPPQYVYTKLPALRPRLLAEAQQDAINRARTLVRPTGGTLGTVQNVDVGVFQVTPRNSTQVSDTGVYDTSTLQKDVTAVVNITFSLG
jgi:hypothetical protein